MVRSKLVVFSSLWAMLLGATLVVGCGDDDGGDADQPSGGTGNSGGARAGSGGGGRGGTSGGGAAGKPSGEGGQVSAGAGAGGQGGEDAQAGGVGGGGGSGPEAGGPISRVNDTLIPGVNDLRGLTYSKSGKIYGSGHVGADAKSVDRELAVVRLNADGTLDKSFGQGGIVTHNLATRVVETEEEGAGGVGGAGGAGGAPGTVEVVVNDGDENSIGVVELANGDLVVQANVRDASGKGMDVVLLRLNDEGETVTSFGDDGVQRIDFGWSPADDATFPNDARPNDQGWGVNLDTSSGEEKLVVNGFGPAKMGAMTSGMTPVQRTDNDRYVARVLASDGSFDPEFNQGKVFTLNTGGTFSDGARRAIVEEDGSILSTGYTNYGEGLGNHIVLIRLEPDGTPDGDFGFGIALPGVVRSNPFLSDGGIAECYSAGKQSDGRYVTVGYGRATAANTLSSFGWSVTDAVDLVSFGVLPSAIDTTFGRDGTLAIQSEELALGNTEDRGRDLVVLADDRVVFAGRLGPNPALFVTTPGGELDTDSGEDGVFAYDPLPETSHFYRIALSADGTRIAASTNNHADGVRVAVLEVGED